MDAVATIISGLERCGVYLRAATIQGWHLLTLVSIPMLSAYDTIVRWTWRVKWTKRSVSIALCAATASTRRCRLHFWGDPDCYVPQSPRTTMTGMLCLWRRMERLSTMYCVSYCGRSGQYRPEILQFFHLWSVAFIWGWLLFCFALCLV